MQRTLLNIVLLLAVAGVGAALYFGHNHGGGAQPILPHMKASSIHTIRIHHPGKPAIVLDRKNGHWFLRKPVRSPAQDSQVKILTDLASMKSRKQFGASGVNLKNLSLKPPQWTIKLNNTLLKFGGRDPIKQQRYVQIGHTVHLLSLVTSAPMDADYSDLVDHGIIPRGRKLVSVKTKRYTLHRGPRHKWTLQGAPKDAAPNAAYKLAQAWMQARGEWLDMLSKKLLARKPIAEADVKLDNGKTIHYLELENKNQLVLARKDLNVAYYIPGRNGSRLFQVPTRQSEKQHAHQHTATGRASLPAKQPGS